jgi:hypothetical protein
VPFPGFVNQEVLIIRKPSFPIHAGKDGQWFDGCFLLIAIDLFTAI